MSSTQRRLDGEYAADPLYGGPPLPPYDNVPITRRVPTMDGSQSDQGRNTFLQQVGMEVGSLAGIHGDRAGIRNVP